MIPGLATCVQQNHAQVGRTEAYNKRSHCSAKARCETQPDNTTREPSAVLVHAVSHHTHEACVVCGCSTSDCRQPGADRWLILRNQKLRVRASWGRWMLNFENSKAMRERRALSRGIVWQALQYLQKSDHERRLAHQCGVAPLHAATRATWLTRKLLAEQPRPRFFTDAFVRFTED